MSSLSSQEQTSQKPLRPDGSIAECYRCKQSVTPHGKCGCKDGITLILADCRDVLPLLEEGSVDLILTDPPYGARRPSDRSLVKSQRFAEVVGNENVNTEWAHYRCLKEGGACYCFCTWDTLEQWRKGLSDAGFRIRSCIVWDKVIHGLADTATCWAPQHEIILFGAIGRHKLLGSRPRDVIRCTRVNANSLQHPYQKPLALLYRFLLPSSQEDALVLDPFAGSGTTGRACKDLGRKAILIEIEERYVKIAARRLEQEVLFT